MHALVRPLCPEGLLKHPIPPFLGGELLGPVVRLMGPIGFQKALQDPGPRGSLLDELVEDWYTQLQTH